MEKKSEIVEDIIVDDDTDDWSAVQHFYEEKKVYNKVMVYDLIIIGGGPAERGGSVCFARKGLIRSCWLLNGADKVLSLNKFTIGSEPRLFLATNLQRI